MLRVISLLVFLSAPASAQSHDGWISLAQLWIRDVPEPLIAACLKSTGAAGAAGAVEARMNALGDLSLEAVIGGEPVRRCVELVGLRLGTSEVVGGISVLLHFGLPKAQAGFPQDAWIIVDEWRPHPSDEPFGQCEGHEQCAAGELCERSCDGGLCIDMRAVLRRQSPRAPSGPASPDRVHFFARSDPRCADAGVKSDKVIIRVVSPSLRPLEAQLDVAEFGYATDGGVGLKHAPQPIELGRGRGFSPRRPMMVFSRLEGCRSTGAVIAPDVSACVLLVVQCPSWLEQ